MKGMEQGNRRWIIRNASGQIDGPFTTEKVLYKIGRGEFSGEEMISHYPGGKWIAISQDPQFYDKLLEVLSDDPNAEKSEDTAVLEFTRPESYSGPESSRAKVDASEAPTDPGIKPSRSEEGEYTSASTSTSASSSSTSASKKDKKRKRRRPEDIELVDMRPALVKAIMKRARWPLLVTVAGIAAAVVFLATSGTGEERMRLIAPQKNIAQVAPKTLEPRIRSAISEFAKDTLTGYIKAQNEFVFVVERNLKNADVMAWLCLTYLQLWPYTYQDYTDSKVVSKVVQMSLQVDPGGVNSNACRVVDLAVRGPSREEEAKSLVESVLDSWSRGAQPPTMFYFLKGFLLENSGKHETAIGYLQSAEKLWPQWILPFVIEAQALTKLERYNEAGNIYRNVLRSNPGHTVARIELGILEYKYFNRNEQGERYLKQALESVDAPRSVLSRGYLGLAEIALKRQDNGRALSHAQRAYSLSASNIQAKNLIVQLGGLSKVPKGRGWLEVFEGDQAFREGDYHKAQEHYKQAYTADRNALAALKAAQCLWRMSLSTEAIQWLNEAIKADPKMIEAYVTMADYQAQRYDFLAAARVLERARKENPRSHEVFRGFAVVELRRNNAKGALVYGKQALQLYENDVETLIVMAEASIELRDYKMAYNYAAKAVEMDVNHRKAQVAYAEAIAGLQGVDAGSDYLLKLVNSYSSITEYRLALGKMFLADERFQQAEEIFRQVIRLEEKPKEAYVELAKCLKAQGNNDEALDLLLKAAVLDPADAEPLFLAGSILIDMKEAQKAMLQFNRVLTINKLFPLVHYQLGRAAMLLSDPKAALDYTAEEKKANPNLADAYLLAAEAHTVLGQYSACAGEYQKAIKLRPQQASIYVKLAQCYRKSGNIDAAMAMLNVASTKESGLADIYKEYGAIYELKSDSNHAIESYNTYFNLDPDAPDRSQIEERINALQRSGGP